MELIVNVMKDSILLTMPSVLPALLIIIGMDSNVGLQVAVAFLGIFGIIREEHATILTQTVNRINTGMEPIVDVNKDSFGFRVDVSHAHQELSMMACSALKDK